VTDRRIVLLAVAMLAACSDPVAGPVDYAYTWAVNDCAPWDGAAVTVYFSTSGPDAGSIVPPYLSVSVWTDPLQLVGRSHTIAGAQADGAASLCDRAGSCRTADAGWIRFDAFESEERLDGVIRVQFGADVVEGSFSAQWRDGQPLCG